MTENIKIRIKESNMISALPSLLFSHFDENLGIDCKIYFIAYNHGGYSNQ